MTSTHDPSFRDLQDPTDDAMEHIPDIYIHIIDQYLGCRDKVVFLSTSRRIHNALKEGNADRRYRNHFISDKKYNTHWKWNLKTPGSPFVPAEPYFHKSLSRWEIVKHSVNTSLACGHCRHKVSTEATLLPHLYVQQSHEGLHAMGNDHLCPLSYENEIKLPRNLPTHPALPHRVPLECPITFELYSVEDKEIFGDLSLKKTTQLVCNTFCFNQRLQELEMERDRPFMVVGTSIEAVVKHKDHYMVKLKRRIVMTPELTVVCHFNARGYMTSFELQPFLLCNYRGISDRSLRITTYSILPVEQVEPINKWSASKLPFLEPGTEFLASYKLTAEMARTDFFPQDSQPVRPNLPASSFQITYFSRGYNWHYHLETPYYPNVFEEHDRFDRLRSLYSYLQESYASLQIPVAGTLKVGDMDVTYYVKPNNPVMIPEDDQDANIFEGYFTQEDEEDYDYDGESESEYEFA